jgi:hypothetical protein
LGEIESAGFVYVNFDYKEDRFTCQTFGESTTLRVKSKPEDKEKIERMFNALI